MLNLPPPATSAENEKGNAARGAKSCTSRFTLSRARGLVLVFAWPSAKWPLVIFTSLAEMARGWLAEGGGAAGCALGFPPRVEKFHAPFADCSSTTAG